MPPERGSDPWWAREFDRLKPKFIAYLGRRSMHGAAEDIVAKVGVELTTLFNGDAGPNTPEELERLLWRMIKFRARDELRGWFVRSVRSVEPEVVAAFADPAKPAGPDAAAEIDARRFLLAVARRIDELPEDERRLILRDVDVDDDEGEPLSAGERVRRHRLRRALASGALEDSKRGAKR